MPALASSADLAASTTDFPEGIEWEGIGYKLEKFRKDPNTLHVKLNTDTDLEYDTYLFLDKEDVNELVNTFTE